MNRNRERRSFTVAAKSSGQQGFVSIPAKAPRVPQKAARRPVAPDPWADRAEAVPTVPAERADAGPRRILPNLIAWEAPAPEPEAALVSEPVLPRVRRVAPQAGSGDAPRRRGRPRKNPLPIEAPAPAAHPPEPVPVAVAPRTEPSPVFVRRKVRPQSQTLRPGERWKRRLPRTCW